MDYDSAGLIIWVVLIAAIILYSPPPIDIAGNGPGANTPTGPGPD
jgi:hypothetical protein